MNRVGKYSMITAMDQTIIRYAYLTSGRKTTNTDACHTTARHRKPQSIQLRVHVNPPVPPSNTCHSSVRRYIHRIQARQINRDASLDVGSSRPWCVASTPDGKLTLAAEISCMG